MRANDTTLEAIAGMGAEGAAAAHGEHFPGIARECLKLRRETKAAEKFLKAKGLWEEYRAARSAAAAPAGKAAGKAAGKRAAQPAGA